MTPPPAPQLDPAAPRVLLIGHAGSGKSSLLGALIRAGETQGDALNAEVIDPTRTLDQFRDHVYFNAPLDEPDAELVTHTVRLRPWRIDTRPMFDPFNVVLLDCDGSAAQALLKRPDPILSPDGGTIASAVVQADALVLAVDARSDEEQLDAAFEEFDTFLSFIGQAKVNAREIGGFPIYLVLTRCDLLAEPVTRRPGGKPASRSGWRRRRRGSSTTWAMRTRTACGRRSCRSGASNWPCPRSRCAARRWPTTRPRRTSRTTSRSCSATASRRRSRTASERWRRTGG